MSITNFFTVSKPLVNSSYQRFATTTFAISRQDETQWSVGRLHGIVGRVIHFSPLSLSKLRNVYPLLVPPQQRSQKFHSFLGKERIISVLEKFKPPKISAEKQLKTGGVGNNDIVIAPGDMNVGSGPLCPTLPPLKMRYIKTNLDLCSSLRPSIHKRIKKKGLNWYA